MSDSRLGRWFAAAVGAHAGRSGFAVLGEGTEAWLSRTALADYADHTIDLQYYLYAADRSGLDLLSRLAAAADRGVKVRLLVDDSNLAVSDVVAAQLATHPNIDVRVFNPFAGRVRWLRIFEGLLRLKRLNRRMHNKLFAVDGCVAVVGGRNVGDDYFDADPVRNFTDVDLLAVGPVVREAISSFDEFWNSPYAVRPEDFLQNRPARIAVQRLVTQLAADHSPATRPRPTPAAQTRFLRTLAEDAEALVWGEARFLHDPVQKVHVFARRTSVVGAALLREWHAAHTEVLLVSAYFVPRRLGLRLTREAVRRGVQVSVLTNSLASNDVALVHAGYARYRRRLLALGARLFEFRRWQDPVSAVPGYRPREVSLHTKLAVFDRKVCWVGSFNFDPRSFLLNTEVGLMVRSAPLAERLAAVFARDTAPEHAWQVELRPLASAAAPLGQHRWQVIWLGSEQGVPVMQAVEPDTSRWRRWWVRLAAHIPGVDTVL